MTALYGGHRLFLGLSGLSSVKVMLERMGDKKTSGLTLPAVRRLIQKYLMLYSGICPICNAVIFDDS